jgi:hypothetical protein
LFFFIRKHITPDCRRNIGAILWPIQNSIRIYGWRLDHLVDLIEIKFMVSSTLWMRICGWLVVYRPLVPRNQVWANNLWLCKQLYENKLKLRWLELMLRWPNLIPRQLTWGIKWMSLSNYCQPLGVHVVYLVALLVLVMKIRLRLRCFLKFTSIK